MKQISNVRVYHRNYGSLSNNFTGTALWQNDHKALFTIVIRFLYYRGTQRGNELRLITVMTETIVVAFVMLLMNWLLKCGTVRYLGRALE